MLWFVSKPKVVLRDIKPSVSIKKIPQLTILLLSSVKIPYIQRKYNRIRGGVFKPQTLPASVSVSLAKAKVLGCGIVENSKYGNNII